MMHCWIRAKVATCALVFLILNVAPLLLAEHPDDDGADGSVGMVVAIDCSGSMRASFAQALGRVDALLTIIPDGSRIALIRFGEQPGNRRSAA